MNPTHVFAAAALLFAPAVTPTARAAPQDDRAGRRGVSPTDVATARQALLDAATPQEREFDSLIRAAFREATARKLASVMDNPEAQYEPEHLALREEIYGELRNRPALREFLRTTARRTPNGAFDFVATTAALVLADAPVADDLPALLDGYRATPAESRAGIARQLGRALAVLRTANPPPPTVAEALELLRADAGEGKAVARGAAIEGLFRAGCEDEALAILKPLLIEGADPYQTVTLLSACSRFFRRPNLDPLLKARALAATAAVFNDLLDSNEPTSTTGVISGKGRSLRAAITFLQEVGGDAEFELLLRCLTEPNGFRLLGMDGLQNLRFALQGKRGKVAPELGARVDEHYLGVVLEAGQRLFDLEEAPFDQDEKEQFFLARDLRYNALSYLVDQFFRNAALKERIGREGDLPALLVALAQSREDIREDPTDAQSPYVVVLEKTENRTLALQLLALIEREWNRRPGLDVFAEAYGLLCLEIQAPLQPIAEVVAFRKARAPGLELTIPVRRTPDDPWIRGACCQAIANLGYIVHTEPTRIRIEVDAANPWPWAEQG
ncbi:MAG: hypothetical protein FJ293_00625 [Planctomycetes bacterium]|nr:hypothetical protein [Planctomycetota bacterium]